MCSIQFHWRMKMLILRGGARNFPTGADCSNEGAKIWLSEYYKSQKSPENRVSPSDGGLACSDGGYSPLALPWRHPCLFSFPEDAKLCRLLVKNLE